MDAGFDAHLAAGSLTVDGDDAALLRAVEEEGSLNGAATSLGRSYSRVQKRITALEAELGTLVDRRRGGPSGGGSQLTDAARDVLAQFDRLQDALADTAETAVVVLRGTVVDRDGELVTVETPAGPVRAVCFEDATAAQVTIRADAVTLHPPAAAPAEAGTSARNRFSGTVTEIAREEAVALVTVQVDGGVSVRVLVTLASLETLGLVPGESVVATFKATATRATPV